ncbi:hypothetical protein E8E14_001747 [Neopestalotiopsis sp. 37M]|nr:hypothetical protein E8E14_001747 [Neopestalotiopsis sp. 37M]
MAENTLHPECPSAPVLRRNGFELRGRQFGPTQTTPTPERRIEGSRLLVLFYPGRLRSWREQDEAQKTAKDLFKRSFFVAQLRWYGIPFRSSALSSELQQLLRDSVVAGRCEQVPMSVVQLERDLRRDHEPALRAWDRAVDDWTIRMDSSHREASKTDRSWSAAMRDHDRLVQQVQRDGPRVHRNSIEPITLQKCRGSYVIRCHQVSKEWPSMALFTLDVSRGVAPTISAGNLDLGYFEGTMLIALSEDTLEDYMKDQSESESDTEENDDESDRSSDSDDHDEEEPQSYRGLGSKRKQFPTKAESSNIKRQCDRPIKTARTSVRRVFVRLRGRETGEGEIQPDPVSGYLDFSNEDFTKFVGMIDLPYLSGSVKLEGFKVSTTAKRQYESWSSFSEAEYERARVARWR